MMASTARGRKRKDAAGKTGEKRFVCQANGCGRGFTRAEHLQRHLLNHSTGEFTCARCRAHFKRRDLLGKPRLCARAASAPCTRVHSSLPPCLSRVDAQAFSRFSITRPYWPHGPCTQCTVSEMLANSLQRGTWHAIAKRMKKLVPKAAAS